MKERSFSNEEYRFGFNTQEKSTELGEDTYTAEFWQYDSKIARRWNNDPRPNTSISVYAAFAGNPIMISDVKGDTTHVFNEIGKYLGRIDDNTSGGNETHFISEDRYNHLIKNSQKLSDKLSTDNLLAFWVRESSFAYIGSETYKEMEVVLHESLNEGKSTATQKLKEDIKAQKTLDAKMGVSTDAETLEHNKTSWYRFHVGKERAFVFIQYEGTKELGILDLSLLIPDSKRTRNSIDGNALVDAIDLVKEYGLSVFAYGHSHVPWAHPEEDPRNPTVTEHSDYTPILAPKHVGIVLTHYNGRLSISIHTAGGKIVDIKIGNGSRKDPTPKTPKID